MNGAAVNLRIQLIVWACVFTAFAEFCLWEWNSYRSYGSSVFDLWTRTIFLKIRLLMVRVMCLKAAHVPISEEGSSRPFVSRTRRLSRWRGPCPPHGIRGSAPLCLHLGTPQGRSPGSGPLRGQPCQGPCREIVCSLRWESLFVNIFLVTRVVTKSRFIRTLWV